ncbi:Glutamyl aminopeptidase [Aphelenchoides besseyi]|nr:Glutamyl aminopeptidase [Aphelenchoides besseyi]
MSLLRSDHKLPKGITYVRATCLPADELEPCIRGSIHHHLPIQNGSLTSQQLNGAATVLAHFNKNKQQRSYVAQRKPRSCMEKCVYCSLIQALFFFGIFLTILIGHWISEIEFGSNDTFPIPAINKGVNGNVTTTVLPLFDQTNQSVDGLIAPHDTATDQIDIVTLQPPHSNSPVKLTLRDVYAPDAEEPRPNVWTHKSTAQFAKAATHQLPHDIRPLHYELEFDFTEFATNEHLHGRARILVESFGNSTVNEIHLHAASNIFIERLQVERDDHLVVVNTVRRDLKRDLVLVELNQRLAAGWYRLLIEFRTRICQSETEGTHCISQMIYGKDGSKTRRRLVGFTTKFEPAFAKTFLPCWDEPKFRSTFNVSIIHPLQLSPLFNTRPLGSAKEIRADVGLTKYRETPQMPVFLFGFSEMTPLELHTTRHLPLSIWTQTDGTVGGHFAAHFAPVIFDRVEKDFEVLYPLDKLDLVVTSNYPVDAMQNWGLIVFRDSNILLPSSALEGQNMTVDRIAEQYRVQKVIAHEVIHQWFGSMISVLDWEDVWLSEGFTSYFVFDFLNTDHPHLTDNEYYMELIEMLKRQTSNHRTALVHSTETQQDADDLFDGVNLYTKGAVMVKMIKDLLGLEKFRQGVTRFLAENSFKAVKRDDLWSALPAFADHGAEEERLSTVIEGWLLNRGIPEIILSRNYDDQTIRITQRVSDHNNYVVYLADSWNASAIPPSIRSRRDVSVADEQKHRQTRRRNARKRQRGQGNALKRERNRIPVFRGDKFPSVDPQSTRPTELQRQVAPKHRRADPNETPLWSIPVGYSFGSIRSSSGQTVRQFWLHNETIRFVDLGVQSYQYILANPHWIYPYKVNYDLDNWRLLIDQLHRDYTDIPVMSRMQLIVDAETYLSLSDVPQLYVRLLGYLAKEEDLGVLLVGLDAMHGLVDLVSGTPLVGPLLIHFTAVIQQLDRHLDRAASANVELAAVWLLSPMRLAKLYQLRCAANLPSCDQNRQLRQWISQPSALHADHHQQITAVCHFLFTEAGPAELAALMGLLRQSQNSPSNSQWSVNIQLATCARDEELIENVVTAIVRTRNAAVYLSVLQASYSIQYNRKFREVFWRGIGRLSTHERQLLFAVNTGKPDRIAKLLIHAVKTNDELELVENLLDQWPSHLQVHLKAAKRKLLWLQTTAAPQIHKLLIEDIQ